MLDRSISREACPQGAAAIMTDSSPHRAPAHELQLRAARAHIAGELGAARLAQLHRPNLALDVAAIVGTIALFLVLAWELARGSAASWQWWASLVLQGDLIVVMAILNHDAFVHRKLLPTPLRWVVSQVLAWPAQMRAAVYERQHLVHHRALGTDGDTEMHKHGLDSRWRRFIYATPALIVYRAVFYRGVIEQQKSTQSSLAHGGEQRLRWERNTRRVLLGLVLASLVWDWRFAVLGYLLPFATITPLVNSVRIVLEHFDLDRENPLWTGTFYRTGFFSRVLFWWGTGDCHIVHHFYANIPFYRMGEALREMRPILQRAGVYEHKSLLPLLGDWFGASRGHWSLPAAAKAAKDPDGAALTRPAA